MPNSLKDGLNGLKTQAARIDTHSGHSNGDHDDDDDEATVNMMVVMPR